ncbi:MAG: aminodeoxychorismate/anthranilate synthase component II [bacterium]|nr:aminodeoxychorismate/anthranilate synthase component II [bacterium]
MILMLDNYDSFTYNLVQYLESLGAELNVLRNDELSVEQALEREPSAIVLSPGPGRPESSGIMNDLIKAAVGKLPVLGVCLGHQAIAQVYGGRISYAPSIMHGKTSRISHDGSPLFKEIDSPFEATRYHSLTVEPESLPEELKVTAWTEDGVIMGLQHRQHALYGVQFHPESILTSHGQRLLQNFLDCIPSRPRVSG